MKTNADILFHLLMVGRTILSVLSFKYCTSFSLYFQNILGLNLLYIVYNQYFCKINTLRYLTEVFSDFIEIKSIIYHRQ